MGRVFVISGPSGAGLKEIVGQVLDGRTDIGSVVPVTARKRKSGEQDGVGFWFYDLEGWNAMKESGELLRCVQRIARAGKIEYHGPKLLSSGFASSHTFIIRQALRTCKAVTHISSALT